MKKASCGQNELAVCPECGKKFRCSYPDPCWCSELYVPAETIDKLKKKYGGCLCPECLTSVSGVSGPQGK
jgi:hypothetical protein